MAITKKAVKSALAGALTGAVCGLFGGGGGMVAVPLLKNLSGCDEKRAHATAIFVIAPVCAASVITYIAGGWLNLAVAIPASIGATAGGFLGAKLLGILPDFAVNAVFVVIMLAAGLRLLF